MPSFPSYEPNNPDWAGHDPAYDPEADLWAAVDKGIEDARWADPTYREVLRRAVNGACTCGGRGPDDDPCPACAVWHRLVTDEETQS